MTSTDTRYKKNNGASGASFNLKAVVQETGLKPDTLRAWERRYGLPNPNRTVGGHRLYSQRDIDTLKWLVTRQEEGLSISRAVDLWKKISASGKDPLQELPLMKAEPQTSTLPSGATLIQMRDAWMKACMEFDERSAENVLSQALAMYSPETVCLSLLQKGLAEIGVGWYEGRVTAQQEHFASALAMRRMEALVAGTPPPTRTGRILIGCAPEEEHTFSSLLLTLLLRRRGWEALYLGANVPIARLEATIAAAEPRLVVLTAQSLHTAATLFAMADVLVKENVPLAFGGLVFSAMESLRSRIPGHFLGQNLEDAPAMIEQLIANPRPHGEVNFASDSYMDALQHFLERQAKLESIVWELMVGVDVRPNYLARANRDLSKSIIAALTLGDITLTGSDMHWIEGLLMNYHYRMPAAALRRYVEAYRDAATEALNGRGLIIVNWLQQILVRDEQTQKQKN